MREYGQIQSAFWTSADAQSFSNNGKLLCSYLLSGPATNSLGCFRLGDGQVQDDLGWFPDVTAKAFEELSGNGWAYRFEGVVLIPNFLKWNSIANPNVAKARFGEFEGIPKGKVRALAARFMLEFCDHWQEETAAYLETVSQTVTGTVYETLNQTPRKQNPTLPNPTQPNPLLPDTTDQAPLPPADPPPPPPHAPTRKRKPKAPSDTSRFGEFWEVYPRHVSKGTALKAFAKVSPTPELFEKMMAALKAQARSMKWQTEPQYIPYPATWLNNQRWEDEVERAPPPSGKGPAPPPANRQVHRTPDLDDPDLFKGNATDRVKTHQTVREIARKLRIQTDD